MFQKGQSGNPAGRPSAGQSQQEILIEALKVVEKEKGKTLLAHACQEAFEDNKMLIAVLKKIIPDMRAIEVAHNCTLELKKDRPLTQEELEVEMKRRGLPVPLVGIEDLER